MLRRILAEETDPDLLERAKLAFRAAIRRPSRRAGPGATPRGYRQGGAVAEGADLQDGQRHAGGVGEPARRLAELAFKSLPDDAKHELGRQGYDAENFWERLRKLGPTQIVEIVGEDGGRIQIWTE